MKVVGVYFFGEERAVGGERQGAERETGEGIDSVEASGGQAYPWPWYFGQVR